MKDRDTVFEYTMEQLKAKYGALLTDEISELSENLSQVYRTCTLTPTKIQFSIQAADLLNLGKLNEEKLALVGAAAQANNARGQDQVKPHDFDFEFDDYCSGFSL